MTVTNASAVQLSDTFIEFSWTTDEVANEQVVTADRDGGGFFTVATLAQNGTDFVYVYTLKALDVVGAVLVFQASDGVGADQAPALTVIDVDAAYTYGQVSYLNTVPRYTTLIDVKKALNITDTTLDADLTTAIVAAELQIDVYNERSFPDTGVNPQIPGIPSTISVWALDASVAVFKLRDTSAGGFEVGNDAWIGAVDVTDQVRRALRRNPLALGYKIKFGVA